MKSALHNEDDKPKKMKKTKKHLNDTIKKLLTDSASSVVNPKQSPIKSVSTPSLSSNNNANIIDIPLLPEDFFKLLQEKINPILAQEIRDKERAKTIMPEDFKHLEMQISEYLKSFVILGYTLNSEKMVIVHAPTVQDHDALVEHLRQTFVRVIGNIDMGQ